MKLSSLVDILIKHEHNVGVLLAFLMLKLGSLYIVHVDKYVNVAFIK